MESGLCGGSGRSRRGLQRTNGQAQGDVGEGVISQFIAQRDSVQFNSSVIFLEQSQADWNVLQRYGQPDDVAKLVSFLVSDDAAFITGEMTSSFDCPRIPR